MLRTKPDTGTAHTPWTVRPSGDGDGLWTVEDANGGIVFFGMEEERAKLFAAAPDMFEALRDVVTFAALYKGKMEDTLGDEALAALGETALAALTRAEGRS